MLGHILYELPLALARGRASVGACQNRPLIASLLRHFKFLYITLYDYTLNFFTFRNETVNTQTNAVSSPFQRPFLYIF